MSEQVDRFNKLKEKQKILDREVIKLQEQKKMLESSIADISKKLTDRGINLDNPEETLKLLEKEILIELDAWEKDLEKLETKVNKAKEVLSE